MKLVEEMIKGKGPMVEKKKKKFLLGAKKTLI
jgi:hypothetical protein